MRLFLLNTGTLFLSLTSLLLAQTGGTITGEVKDPSGALVQSASITVTNAATNVARTAETNSAGLYNFPGLIPGTYQVKASSAGFQTSVAKDIELQVQQTARVDFELTVGQASQTVEVVANATQLTTDNATVGTVIEERRIMQLPLNGRSFFSLVALSPNVTFGFAPAAQASGRLGGTRGALTISLTGARATWTNYTLDGIANTDIDFNSYIMQPSVDALQEFKVQTGIYPAEFGRAAGQVNVSTKPGSNEFHGTLSEFLRNDKLDARAYDFSSASRSATNPSPSKAPYRQNQYGFTVSGPIWIPKVFNGRNRLFFMSNYEGFNSRLTQPTLGTVLTPEMRKGDFSSILAAGFALADPFSRGGTCPNITQTKFPNPQIPANRLSKGSQVLLEFTPAPNLPTPPGLPFRNYQFALKTPVDKYTVTERIDFNENSKSQWFGRYSLNDESTLAVLPALGLNDGNTLYTKASQWVLSNVRTISPTKVNEARFGYNSLFNNITQQLAGVRDVSKEIGVPVKITDPNSWGIPSVSLSQNLTSFGNPTSSPFQINNKYYQFVDNFSWVIGKHSLRIGGEYRLNQFPQLGNEFPRGQFIFNGQFTNTVTATSATAASQSGGYTGADFLLGTPNNSIIAVALAAADFTNKEWATYLDDTWRISPKLTLSLGIRWEVMQPLFDKLGNELNIQLNQPLPYTANVQDQSKHPVYVRTGKGNFYDGIDFRYLPFWATPNLGAAPVGGNPPLQTVRDGRLGDRLINTNYRNFAPRIGIAYSPSEKWSLRAGFGIFYSEESKNSVFDFNRGLGGRTGALAGTTYGVPTFTYDNFINTAALPVSVPIGLTWAGSSHLPNTSTMQYILNLQRSIGKSTMAEVGYIGSQSRHLLYLSNQNQGILNPALPAVQRIPYPEFGASGIQMLFADGVGSYNALSGKLTQRFSSNLSTLLSYTWSKSIDTTSAIRGTGNGFSPQDARCPNSCEKGVSDFHVPQRFVASILGALPFGKGQRFLNRGGIVNQLVGGWQASTITTLQSGGVVNVSSWDAGGTNFVTNATRLNCVSGVDPVKSDHSQTGWWNSAAFSNTLAGTFGNCGRNTLRGPWRGTQDVSLIKLFPIAERRNLEFRMELFNAFNHTILSSPNNVSWGGGSGPAPVANFGQINSTSTSMRQIQFALKLNF